MDERKRIFSGMRPTGRLHYGHMAGALINWVKLQKDVYKRQTLCGTGIKTTLGMGGMKATESPR